MGRNMSHLAKTARKSVGDCVWKVTQGLKVSFALGLIDILLLLLLLGQETGSITVAQPGLELTWTPDIPLASGSPVLEV